MTTEACRLRMNNSSSMVVYCLTLMVISCTLNGLASSSPYSNGGNEQELSSNPATELHIRRKRHIPEQLVTDKRMKLTRHNERILLINKLLQHAGPEFCKCKSSRNAIEDRSRSREKFRRFRAAQSRGCSCDMFSTLKQLSKKAFKSGKRSHGNNSLNTYLSTLDDRSKMHLRATLENEIQRLRRIEIIRKRRAKLQRIRAAALRNPLRMFQGLNFYMG